MYELVVTRSARKDLLDLPTKISEQVERAIDRLLARLNEGQRPQEKTGMSGIMTITDAAMMSLYCAA